MKQRKKVKAKKIARKKVKEGSEEEKMEIALKKLGVKKEALEEFIVKIGEKMREGYRFLEKGKTYCLFAGKDLEPLALIVGDSIICGNWKSELKGDAYFIGRNGFVVFYKKQVFFRKFSQPRRASLLECILVPSKDGVKVFEIGQITIKSGEELI